MKNLRNAGFTLVELSVTLVIIGIVIAAITSGSHLIQAARINKIIAEITGYAEAVENFRLTYHALPGDMPNATNFWGVATANGNGDESILGLTSESLRAWQHLVLADMIIGEFTGIDAGTPDFAVGTNVPTSAEKEAYFFMQSTPVSTSIYGDTGVIIQMGSSESNISPDGGAITPADAYIIDKKIDSAENRIASDGSIYATRARGQATTANSCVDTNYLSDASAQYVLDDQERSCRLVLWVNKQ